MGDVSRSTEGMFTFCSLCLFWLEILKSSEPPHLRHAAKGSWTTNSKQELRHCMRATQCICFCAPSLQLIRSFLHHCLPVWPYSPKSCFSPLLYEAPAQPGMGEASSKECWDAVLFLALCTARIQAQCAAVLGCTLKYLLLTTWLARSGWNFVWRSRFN